MLSTGVGLVSAVIQQYAWLLLQLTELTAGWKGRAE